jgi:hypothetical protein
MTRAKLAASFSAQYCCFGRACAFAEDGAGADLFVVLEPQYLSAHVGGISAPQQGLGALISFSGAELRDHIFRASLRPVLTP